jgi:hypothetical protein
MQRCGACGGLLDKGYRYCPWCAAPQRLKLVEFFSPHPGFDEDHDKALRVSRYLGSEDHERHVRFSIWGGRGEVKAAMSLTDEEADKVAQFLLKGSRRASERESRL